MAREPDVKFANYEQERQHYINWRRELEDDLRRLKDDQQRDLRRIYDRCESGTDECVAAVAALKRGYQAQLSPLRNQITFAQNKLNELKAKVQIVRQRSDPFSVIRDDGEVNSGAALYAILKTLESIEGILLSKFGDSMPGK